ncbi:hypothetical protein Pcinc_026189, partial [Petrolisthes cinctipes]
MGRKMMGSIMERLTEGIRVLVVVLLVSAVVVWMLTKASQILFPLDYPEAVYFIPCSLAHARRSWLRFPVRLVLFSVWAMSLILDSTYQGHITAFIAMPRFTPAIDDHEHLSAETSIIPVTERESTTETMITCQRVSGDGEVCQNVSECVSMLWGVWKRRASKINMIEWEEDNRRRRKEEKAKKGGTVKEESERASFKALAARLELYSASFLDTTQFFAGVADGKWAFV